MTSFQGEPGLVYPYKMYVKSPLPADHKEINKLSVLMGN